MLEHTRGEIEDIGIDNPDYDSELAKIYREESEETEKEGVEEKMKKTSKNVKKNRKCRFI